MSRMRLRKNFVGCQLCSARDVLLLLHSTRTAVPNRVRLTSTMSEMRFNPITLDWVIMAPDRALKPNDFLRDSKAQPGRPQYRPECPFCPGNESMTEHEICRASAPDGSWTVRVMPNKFPAFVPSDNPKWHTHGTFSYRTAAGSH